MRKKGKLYTANKWNTPLFMPRRHLFDGLSGSSQLQTFDYKATIPDKIDTSRMPEQPAPYQSSSNGGGFNWGTFGKVAGGVASMIPENQITIGDRTFERGLWDVGDPLYWAADGRKSKTGDTFSNVGVGLTKTGIPPLMFAGAIAKSAGSAINIATGTKTDEDTLDTLNRTTAALNGFNSEAGSYEGLVRPSGMVNYQDVYEGPSKAAGNATAIGNAILGGLTPEALLISHFLRKGNSKARKEVAEKNAALKKDYENAQAWAENSYLNNLYNIQQDQMNNALRHYSAYGGPIETMPMYNDDMPAVNYDFMTDYLTAKKKQAEQKNIDLSNLFAGMPSTMFAGGGSIHIDPKNKGKFNATKKRTGKTTEELTHSKNPLTRKRAIFAQNAAKWHHADGGPMNVLYQLDDRILALGGDIQTHGGDYSIGKIYDVSEKEANRLKSLGYEFTIVS